MPRRPLVGAQRRKPAHPPSSHSSEQASERYAATFGKGEDRIGEKVHSPIRSPGVPKRNGESDRFSHCGPVAPGVSRNGFREESGRSSTQAAQYAARRVLSQPRNRRTLSKVHDSINFCIAIPALKIPSSSGTVHNIAVRAQLVKPAGAPDPPASIRNVSLQPPAPDRKRSMRPSPRRRA